MVSANALRLAEYIRTLEMELLHSRDTRKTLVDEHHLQSIRSDEMLCQPLLQNVLPGYNITFIKVAKSKTLRKTYHDMRMPPSRGLRAQAVGARVRTRIRNRDRSRLQNSCSDAIFLCWLQLPRD